MLQSVVINIIQSGVLMPQPQKGLFERCWLLKLFYFSWRELLKINGD